MRKAPAIPTRNEPRRSPCSWRRSTFGALLALASCTLNPVTKAPEISFTSLEEEKEAGAQGAAQIGEQVGPLSDEALTSYVRSLGARLAANSPRQEIEYKFEILDTDSADAFSLPGGYVYVTRGLLTLLSNESELAGVLAHEIAHLAARHASNTTIGQAASGVLSGIGGVAGGVFGFDRFDRIGAAGSIVPPHNPDQELQADTIGQELAFKAGWDPEGIIDFIRAYERARTDRTAQETGFLQIHPSNSARLEAARDQARKLGKPTAAPDAVLERSTFLAKLRGLVIGQDARAGVFDAKTPTLFVQPDLNFRIRFPDGWSTLNAPAFVAGSDGAITVTLEPAGEGTDLKKVAAEYAAKRKKQQDEAAEKKGAKRNSGEGFTRTKSGVRMLTKKRSSYVIEGTAGGGQATILQYFVEVKPSVYLVTCAMATQAKSQYLGECRRTAATLGPMRKKEREGIRQTTLELAEARPGEQLDDFNERVGNAWSREQTAAANGLSLPYKIVAGQILKYARSQPYEPPARPVAGSAQPTPEADAPDEADAPEADDPGDDD